jgi:glycerol uptake facilitator-like aquaporin
LIICLVAELAGAYLGLAFVYVAIGSIGPIKPHDPDANVFYIFFVELFFTFILMAGIFHCKSERLALSHDLVTALMWCLVPIYFCVMCAHRVTGAALNPTVGLCNTTFYHWAAKEG